MSIQDQNYGPQHLQGLECMQIGGTLFELAEIQPWPERIALVTEPALTAALDRINDTLAALDKRLSAIEARMPPAPQPANKDAPLLRAIKR